MWDTFDIINIIAMWVEAVTTESRTAAYANAKTNAYKSNVAIKYNRSELCPNYSLSISWMNRSINFWQHFCCFFCGVFSIYALCVCLVLI